jgi:hypothetical protein
MRFTHTSLAIEDTWSTSKLRKIYILIFSAFSANKIFRINLINIVDNRSYIIYVFSFFTWLAIVILDMKIIFTLLAYAVNIALQTIFYAR